MFDTCKLKSQNLIFTYFKMKVSKFYGFDNLAIQ